MHAYRNGWKGNRALQTQLLFYLKLYLPRRKKTCPECRHTTTSSTVIRLFINIADPSYADNDEGDSSSTDVIRLQSDNDNLKFRIIEKDAALKSRDETLERIRDENQKLGTNQEKSRNLILTLEQKLESYKILTATHNDQVCAT